MTKADGLFEKYPIAYCMNVHPTLDEDQLIANIEQSAVAVKSCLEKEGVIGPMGIGLWFPASVARKFQSPNRLTRLRDLLERHQLIPFTFNGFPYGIFHQDVVKHQVYQPTWAETERLEYTLDLIRIMDAILPADLDGSISTLPLGWPSPENDCPEFFESCNESLHTVASFLDSMHSNSGRKISICIEPEPGCLLGTAYDLIRFFEQWVFESTGPNWKQDYLNVCHDVCHSTVVNESQADVIRDYQTAGIDIGKVQISSAPIARFSESSEQRQRLESQLRQFSEKRYLHQTTIIDNDVRMHEDLAIALEKESPGPGQEWRVHFHVPVFLETIGDLKTGQADIILAINALKKHSQVEHFEVETYAWNVLPESHRGMELHEGIAKELSWLYQLAKTASQ